MLLLACVIHTCLNRRFFAGYLSLKQKLRQAVAIAHISFTCLSGTIHSKLDNFQQNIADTTQPQTTLVISAAKPAPQNIWQLFVGIAKEITKPNVDDALNTSHENHVNDVQRRSRDLKPALFKELPCRHSPPPLPKSAGLGFRLVLG